jgi:hypothetical protein
MLIYGNPVHSCPWEPRANLARSSMKPVHLYPRNLALRQPLPSEPNSLSKPKGCSLSTTLLAKSLILGNKFEFLTYTQILWRAPLIHLEFNYHNKFRNTNFFITLFFKSADATYYD